MGYDNEIRAYYGHSGECRETRGSQIFAVPPHHLHNAPAPHDAPTPHDARKGRHYYIRLLLAFARTSPQDERSETSFVYSSDAPCGRHGGRGIMGGVSIIHM